MLEGAVVAVGRRAGFFGGAAAAVVAAVGVLEGRVGRGAARLAAVAAGRRVVFLDVHLAVAEGSVVVVVRGIWHRLREE